MALKVCEYWIAKFDGTLDSPLLGPQHSGNLCATFVCSFLTGSGLMRKSAGTAEVGKTNAGAGDQSHPSVDAAAQEPDTTNSMDLEAARWVWTCIQITILIQENVKRPSSQNIRNG